MFYGENMLGWENAWLNRTRKPRDRDRSFAWFKQRDRSEPWRFEHRRAVHPCRVGKNLLNRCAVVVCGLRLCSGFDSNLAKFLACQAWFASVLYFNNYFLQMKRWMRCRMEVGGGEGWGVVHERANNVFELEMTFMVCCFTFVFHSINCFATARGFGGGCK